MQACSQAEGRIQSEQILMFNSRFNIQHLIQPKRNKINIQLVYSLDLPVDLQAGSQAGRRIRSVQILICNLTFNNLIIFKC